MGSPDSVSMRILDASSLSTPRAKAYRVLKAPVTVWEGTEITHFYRHSLNPFIDSD